MSTVAEARAARADLLLIELGGTECPLRIRRALRESDCVHEVVIAGRLCRVLADPGTAPRVAAALRAQGLELAVVILQWWQERPCQALVHRVGAPVCVPQSAWRGGAPARAKWHPRGPALRACHAHLDVEAHATGRLNAEQKTAKAGVPDLEGLCAGTKFLHQIIADERLHLKTPFKCIRGVSPVSVL